ncbi:hypothetical protein ACJMK2_010730 [Sinanodonta woodiana]|uniref:Mab-21-like HhH/H2TH-like domain-containing protein n=1 Tax=Sinanodonta woodiana TaxID=1069815 RepID=A0ABD3VGD4_SINWO
MDVPDYYEDVSLRLMTLLDKSEYADKARWKRIEMWMQYEKLHNTTLTCKKHIRNHVFGSQAEATDLGIKSDIDLIIIPDFITVFPDLQSWEPGSNTLLMITDSTTPPGYVKLQDVYENAPIPVYNQKRDKIMLDAYGRSVLYNGHKSVKFDGADTHHGPANTNYFKSGISSDIIFAYRFLSWPYMALEWIIRKRNHNWPSRETIDVIQQSGTLLVPVGQAISPERHLEWRISLSYGEKILVWQFSSSQYKCYVLLKMINKCFIKPKVGNNVLTSYHCKTCMFYLIESTPATLWQPQNLLMCIELCLITLRRWVEEGKCPNYFIPDENMFLGKVYGPIQSNLVNVLRDLIRQNGKYLTGIPIFKIGQKLIRACQSPVTEIDNEENHFDSTSFTVFLLLSTIKYTWFKLLEDGVLINPWILEMMSSFNMVRHEICTILRSFCCSSLGSCLASKCCQEEVIDQEVLDMAHEFLLLGLYSDVASGKLKLAAFYLTQNNVVTAERVLQNIENNYTFLVANVETEFTKDIIQHRIEDENLSTTELVQNYTAFPVPYLRSEIHCTPRALIPEMFRTTGSNQSFQDPYTNYSQSWAVVDPKLYLHFLEYQCYHQQYKIRQKMAALENMIWVIQFEHMAYKDTALNLLAYCLTKEGFLVDAYKVLSRSVKLRNHNNGAKWQICCLINTAYRCMGSRCYRVVSR